MDRWLPAALDDTPRRLDFQMLASQQPGCIVAIGKHGRVMLGDGYGSYGEEVCCLRAKSGRIAEFRSWATRFLPAAKVAREMERRYGAGKARREPR